MELRTPETEDTPRRLKRWFPALKRAAVCCVLCLLTSICAASDNSEEHQDPSVQLDLDHEHQAENHHRHHVGLFFGGASRFQADHETETGAAIGVEYEYRFAKRWSVGGLFEVVTLNDKHRDAGVVAPIGFYPTERLKLTAGPGFEIEDGHVEFLGRFSISYGIPIWKLTVSPEISVDVLDRKQVLLYGFTIGSGF